uniref:Uncharacterized protein n=1 Tax=Romanomermis culicivorax TaxID=13658 RepID=A0A915KDJ4_ROMCU
MSSTSGIGPGMSRLWKLVAKRRNRSGLLAKTGRRRLPDTPIVQFKSKVQHKQIFNLDEEQ